MKKSGVLTSVHIVGWEMLKLEHSESNRNNFEANSVANRKPMQIRKDRCDVTELRFLCDHSSKSNLNTLKALLKSSTQFYIEIPQQFYIEIPQTHV